MLVSEDSSGGLDWVRRIEAPGRQSGLALPRRAGGRPGNSDRFAESDDSEIMGSTSSTAVARMATRCGGERLRAPSDLSSRGVDLLTGPPAYILVIMSLTCRAGQGTALFSVAGRILVSRSADLPSGSLGPGCGSPDWPRPAWNAVYPFQAGHSNRHADGDDSEIAGGTSRTGVA